MRKLHSYSFTSYDKDHIEKSMNGVSEHINNATGWCQIVDETSNRTCLTLYLLPVSKQSNESRLFEVSMQELGEEVEVRHQCSLEDDRHITSVEELDGV